MIATAFKIDLTDSSNFSTNILKRFLVTHNLALSALIVSLVLFLLFRYLFLQIFIMMFSSKKDEDHEKLFARKKNFSNILDGKDYYNFYFMSINLHFKLPRASFTCLV